MKKYHNIVKYFVVSVMFLCMLLCRNMSVFAESIDEPYEEETKVGVSDIDIASHEDELKVDNTLTLSATVVPSNATDSTVSFKSSDKSIATVSSTGEVKGISNGSVKISVSAGDIVKIVTIEVYTATNCIDVNNSYIILKTGETFQLSANVNPSEASHSLSFKSTNIDIASVNNTGRITAIADGTATVMVSNKD